MLQIKHIKKTYRTGQLVQKALDDVSLNLRDNEFVAILGPSGSGKTTMLNIIGGLDRYDEGDLIINGISTKEYKDRDWDSYRNHSVGFVFQSYNLIPHQSILANVELALTISGVSKAERRRRAIKALQDVGLGDQLHKKPNQLSGGQMQRVSLARALVNDPEILLADEPTGALDSETSRQVMDLLKDVAKDRLVVMVTHNPELAEEYANRIVRVKDGKILEDTNPVPEKELLTLPEGRHENMGKTSMSFLTALSLSFNNLKTKMGRTLLVAFAGSIGIIGIALILSMSNGVNAYIKSIEEETLSEYPIDIMRQTSNMSSMLLEQTAVEKAKDGVVTEQKMVSNIAGGQKVNDLKHFREYLESGKSDIDTYAKAIEYNYGLTPQIWLEEKDELVQVCPDPLMQSVFGGNSMMSAMLSTSSMTERFRSLPADSELYIDQYDVKAGHWPQNKNEAVLVLSPSGKVADLTLYSLGLRPYDELMKVKDAVQNSKQAPKTTPSKEWNYDDFIGISYKALPASAMYEYDSKFKVWKDQTENGEFIKKAVAKGQDLKIVGVVQPKEDTNIAMLQNGIYYSADLLPELMKEASESKVVKEQIAHPDLNIFTDEKFGSKGDASFEAEDLFTVDEDAFKDAFKVDTSALSLNPADFSQNISFDPSSLNLDGLIDPDALMSAMPSLDASMIQKMMQGVSIDLSEQTLTDLFNQVMGGYMDYVKDNPNANPSNLGQGLQAYLLSDEAQNYLKEQINTFYNEQIKDILTQEMVTNLLQSIITGYEEFAKTQPDPADTNANLNAYLQSDQVKNLISQFVSEVQGKLQAVTISDDQVRVMLSHLADGYDTYANANGYPSVSGMSQAFSEYLQQPATQKMLLEQAGKIVNTKQLSDNLTNILSDSMNQFSAAFSTQISQVMSAVMSQVASQLGSTLSSGFANMGDGLENMFSMNPEALAGAFKMNLSEQDFMNLMMSMAGAEANSYENNLKKLGYADVNDPNSIEIYPKDFESKDKIDGIIRTYNEQQIDDGHADREITYTDMVGTMMSSVTTIIDTVSYVLIGFVSVSLVVSSIMIGVITYISVLERKKEIGILRSIGASKHNISEVFNAETFITGLLAGLIGVGISLILLIPINILIHHLSGNMAVNAFLPWQAAVLLIALSTGLTMLGGLLPSKKAANSDPVSALRTE